MARGACVQTACVSSCLAGTASIECLLVVPFRSQRPAVGGVPGQLSRQNASLAFSVCHSHRSYLVLARRPALTLVSYSGLWFPLFPW